MEGKEEYTAAVWQLRETGSFHAARGSVKSFESLFRKQWIGSNNRARFIKEGTEAGFGKNKIFKLLQKLFLQYYDEAPI